MQVETIDRLVPHTSDEHANVISINLDLHFPALPCSELSLEVRDATGTEALKFNNSVSKLRTTSAGTLTRTRTRTHLALPTPSPSSAQRAEVLCPPAPHPVAAAAARPGAPIGMPTEVDFTERVALGMRLNRFMHVLGDALAQLLRFSLQSGCTRDYTAVCPDHWEDRGNHRCDP